jgi:hypothetical protein
MLRFVVIFRIAAFAAMTVGIGAHIRHAGKSCHPEVFLLVQDSNPHWSRRKRIMEVETNSPPRVRQPRCLQARR